MREQRLREKELERLKSFENEQNPVENNFSKGLEKFDVSKNNKN